jgi:hypothetical protein
VITDVQTPPAPRSDGERTPPLQASLAERHLLPKEHRLARGDGTTEQLVNSQRQQHIDLVGPVAPEPSWLARSATRFGTAAFTSDGHARQASGLVPSWVSACSVAAVEGATWS